MGEGIPSEHPADPPPRLHTPPFSSAYVEGKGRVKKQEQVLNELRRIARRNQFVPPLSVLLLARERHILLAATKETEEVASPIWFTGLRELQLKWSEYTECGTYSIWLLHHLNYLKQMQRGGGAGLKGYYGYVKGKGEKYNGANQTLSAEFDKWNALFMTNHFWQWLRENKLQVVWNWQMQKNTHHGK